MQVAVATSLRCHFPYDSTINLIILAIIKEEYSDTDTVVFFCWPSY